MKNGKLKAEGKTVGAFLMEKPESKLSRSQP